MAEALVDSLTDAFDPEKYRDDYREQVLDLIAKKDAGEAFEVPETATEKPKIVDLMAALEASVEAAKSRQDAAPGVEAEGQGQEVGVSRRVAKRTSIVAEVDGRQLELSNLDKVLYPSGFTKGEVIDYHARIAPVAVPHLRGRALTFRRFPNGTDKQGFFEKRCPGHRPEWVSVALGPGDRHGGIEYCCIEEPAALVWAGNMAAIELHAPMALARDLDTPRAVVFDFDPGPRTDIGDCCGIALRTRDILDAAGSRGGARRRARRDCSSTSRSTPTALTHQHAADFALAVGQVLERQLPKQVTTTMAKVQRPGKIFVDWSQNAHHKTTIAPYSLRARPEPTVSTPVSWDEVEAAAAGDARAALRGG